MKLRTLPESFDCYSFSSAEVLQLQSIVQPSFLCSVAGDYTLITASDVPVTGFEEVETGWRCIVINDQLLFNQVGIAAAITGSLAEAGISVLVVSGYKTDYFFVKAEVIKKTIDCLEDAGHLFMS